MPEKNYIEICFPLPEQSKKLFGVFKRLAVPVIEREIGIDVGNVHKSSLEMRDFTEENVKTKTMIKKIITAKRQTTLQCKKTS